MKDLKNKLKAAFFTALLFFGIFGGFYILSNYTKESLLVIVSIIVMAFLYGVWKLIYDELSDTE